MVNNCKTQVGHFLRHSNAVKRKNIIDFENRLVILFLFIQLFNRWTMGNLNGLWNSMSLDETYMYVQGIMIDIAEYFMGPIKDIKYFKLKSELIEQNLSISVLFKTSSVGKFSIKCFSTKTLTLPITDYK